MKSYSVFKTYKERNVYPVNIMIDLGLKYKYNVDIDYDDFDVDAVMKVLDDRYNEFCPEWKIVYDLSYRNGLQPNQVAELMGISQDVIIKMIEEICVDINKFVSFGAIFDHCPRFKPISSITSPMPYPTGLMEVIEIDPAYIPRTYGYVRDQADALDDMINKLLDRQHTAIIDLRFRKGFTISEISEIAGISETEVNSLIHDAVNILSKGVVYKREVCAGRIEYLWLCQDDTYMPKDSDQYKYMWICYKNISERVRRTLTRALGKRYASVENVRDIVSKPNWWCPVDGVGRVYATKALLELESLGIIDSACQGWTGLTHPEVTPQEEVKLKEPEKSNHDVVRRAISLFDNGLRHLNNTDELSEGEIEQLKDRLTLLDSIITAKEVLKK